MIRHKWLAEFCNRSYAEATLCVNEVEVLIERVNSVQVVAFRGTEATWKKGGFWDVLRDLRIGPAGYYGLRGHAGFLSGAKAVEKYLLLALDKSLPVIVTGHSLGGGLAIPAARMLQAKGYRVSQLVTFGTPRCISKGHSHFKSILVTCYEYGNDVVPTYQFWTPRKHLNRTSVGKSRSKNWFFNRTWDDHGIELYMGALK